MNILLFLLNPAPPHLHPVDDGTGTGNLMYEAEFGTGEGFTFQKWYKCGRCGRVFSRKEIGFVHKKPLCLRWGHYQDAIADKANEGTVETYVGEEE